MISYTIRRYPNPHGSARAAFDRWRAAGMEGPQAMQANGDITVTDSGRRGDTYVEFHAECILVGRPSNAIEMWFELARLRLRIERLENQREASPA